MIHLPRSEVDEGRASASWRLLRPPKFEKYRDPYKEHTIRRETTGVTGDTNIEDMLQLSCVLASLSEIGIIMTSKKRKSVT